MCLQKTCDCSCHPARWRSVFDLLVVIVHTGPDQAMCCWTGMAQRFGKLCQIFAGCSSTELANKQQRGGAVELAWQPHEFCMQASEPSGRVSM